MTRALERLSSPIALLIAALTIGYGFYNRAFLTSAEAGQLGQIELVLNDATNPQFVTYVILTLWLIYLVIETRHIAEYPTMIRLGSHRAAAVACCFNSLRLLGTIGGLILLCWVVTSLGLPLSFLSTSANSPSSILAHIGLPAVVALILQLALLTVSLTVLQLVFVTLRLTIAKTSAEVVAAGAIWLWSATSTAGILPSGSPINAGYYFNILVAAHSPTGAVGALVVLCAVVGALFAVLFIFDRSSVREAWTSGWLLYGVLTAIALGTSTSAFGALDSPFSTLDAALGGGTVIKYFSSTLILLGYVFVAQLRANQLQQGFGLLELIRYGSYVTWAGRVLGREACRVLVFLVCLFSAGFLVFFVLGGNSISSPQSGLGIWLFQFFVNGFIQIMFYLIAVFAAVWTSGTPIAGLVSVAVLVVIGGIQSIPQLWIPVQLSNTVLTRSGWATVTSATTTLALSILVIFAYLIAIFRLRLVRI